MNLYGLVAALVGSLAWPSVVILCLFYFLRHAATLVRFVKTVRYGDVEVTFYDARRDVSVIQAERGPVERPTMEADDKILRLAEIDPAVAVIEIWKRLEEKIIRLMQHNGVVRFTTTDRFMKVLYDQKKISSAEFTLFQHLRKIRNESLAHCKFNDDTAMVRHSASPSGMVVATCQPASS